MCIGGRRRGMAKQGLNGAPSTAPSELRAFLERLPLGPRAIPPFVWRGSLPSCCLYPVGRGQSGLWAEEGEAGCGTGGEAVSTGGQEGPRQGPAPCVHLHAPGVGGGQHHGHPAPVPRCTPSGIPCLPWLAVMAVEAPSPVPQRGASRARGRRQCTPRAVSSRRAHQKCAVP